jgi:hypothetical protein
VILVLMATQDYPARREILEYQVIKVIPAPKEILASQVIQVLKEIRVLGETLASASRGTQA